MQPWQRRIIEAYPGKDAMGCVIAGASGAEAGDDLAQFVYQEVMDANHPLEAEKRIRSAIADLECVLLEMHVAGLVGDYLKESVETPLGEQIDGGGEIEN